MPERLKAILDKITAWWKKFNTKQRSVLISIVAVVIVALVILGVVISRPTQVELVEAQSASEASTIKGVLEDNNISYEVDSKLVFFVNKSDEVNAIMALGDNGIPAQAYSTRRRQKLASKVSLALREMRRTRILLLRETKPVPR